MFHSKTKDVGMERTPLRIFISIPSIPTSTTSHRSQFIDLNLVFGNNLDKCLIVHVRSPLLFKSGFAGRYGQTFSLDLDGPTTPNIKKLQFFKVPRPMIGLDEFDGELAEVSSD
jgi:hypothetical protein